LLRLLVNSRVTAALVSDAALVALAIEHGLMLCKRAFRRFGDRKLLNPL
jgi:hypothetical protein